jgi:hypothetical protein
MARPAARTAALVLVTPQGAVIGRLPPIPRLRAAHGQLNLTQPLAVVELDWPVTTWKCSETAASRRRRVCCQCLPLRRNRRESLTSRNLSFAEKGQRAYGVSASHANSAE